MERWCVLLREALLHRTWKAVGQCDKTEPIRRTRCGKGQRVADSPVVLKTQGRRNLVTEWREKP